MIDYDNLIDQIRDPLTSILVDCRGIGNLIAQEESFQPEFEKVLRDTNVLFDTFNNFLQTHVNPDGSVRLTQHQYQYHQQQYGQQQSQQQQQQTKQKHLFFQALISSCITFRTALGTLLKTVRSVIGLNVKSGGNRSLYALLRYKLQENLMAMIDATRTLMRSCKVQQQQDSTMMPANTTIDIELITSTSSGFLMQMKALTEATTDGSLSNYDFDLMSNQYSHSADGVTSLMRECRVEAISGDIAIIEQCIAEIKQHASFIRLSSFTSPEHGGFALDTNALLRTNVDLEQCIYKLVGSIKQAIAVINQNPIMGGASEQPLVTYVPTVDLDEDELHHASSMLDVSSSSSDEEEDALEEDDVVEQEDHVEQESEDVIAVQPFVRSPSMVEIGSMKSRHHHGPGVPAISQPQHVAPAVTATPAPIVQDVPQPRHLGCDLPRIVLTEDSDDEDAPMIWSIPIAAVSPDPFKVSEHQQQQLSSSPSLGAPVAAESGRSHSLSSNTSSSSASASSTAPTKVYNSKDYDIKVLQQQQQQQVPVKGKKGAVAPPAAPAVAGGTGQLGTGTGTGSSKSGGWTIKNPFKRGGKTRETILPETGKVFGEANTKDTTVVAPPASGAEQKKAQPTGTVSAVPQLSNPASTSSSPSLASSKWVSPMPPSRSMLNLLYTQDESAAEDDIPDIVGDGFEDDLLSENFNHDYFDTPVGLRGSTQDPSVQLFEPAKDFTIEEIGTKSKRYSDTPFIGLDHNERHIAHYKQYFYQKEHFNFVCKIPELGGQVIISALKQPETTHKKHRVLIRTKNGVEKILVYSKNTRESSLIKSLQIYLSPIVNLSSSVFKSIKTDKIDSHLAEFETFDLTNKYHFFVFFCGDGQSTEREMLNNERASREFAEFYTFLGKRFQTKNWKRYSGGLDTTDNQDGEVAVYAQLQGIQIVFHVSSLIPSQRRMRLLSNNTCVLIFHEGKTKINPSTFTSPKNKILFEVKKVKVDDGSSIHYKFGVSSNSLIEPFGPMITDPPIYRQDNTFRNLLLTKLINAENSAYSTQQLTQDIVKHRQQKLDDIIAWVKS
ncbi:hypothetical protein SAMD00019534_030800 [Acytostelium subglobosum LB1]|uniref:hypothetical protein n=1 Tax=Acytostelium subglobosum LB1 TaxID=1410327 RepID=UPI0006449D21|nr:hypothetical protein SAMD00019534_030800 [Acytostelium subglobosum LB1]GAM19905.1 hypothetical protein SAMD00019534_030800 [Acytostelium subglobosum LB1]|eukprot:XP_012756667.1 hypothetical protein SAMD00019534_030800 [Acytostelium subglobosum LB1]